MNYDGVVKSDITVQVGKPDTAVPQRNNLSLNLDQDMELYEAQISTYVRWSLRPDISHSLFGCYECVPGPHTMNSQALRG